MLAATAHVPEKPFNANPAVPKPRRRIRGRRSRVLIIAEEPEMGNFISQFNHFHLLPECPGVAGVALQFQ